jgi:hypothetical protein
MMLGDFVGGGAVVIAAKTVLSSSYSRYDERLADAYSVELMQKVRADPKALAAILSRISMSKDQEFELLSDHPDTKARIAAIGKATAKDQPRPMLTAAEWKALKAICAANPQSTPQVHLPQTHGRPVSGPARGLLTPTLTACPRTRLMASRSGRRAVVHYRIEADDRVVIDGDMTPRDIVTALDRLTFRRTDLQTVAIDRAARDYLVAALRDRQGKA